MEYFYVIIPKLLNLILLILLGVYAAKRHFVTKEKLKVLQDLLMNIILPILSFNLLLEQKVTFLDLVSMRGIVLAQLCIYPVLIVIGLLCARLLHMQHTTRNVHVGSMVSGNYAYVVLPLLYSLYQGTYATVYIPIGCSVEALVIWTLGITLFTWGEGKFGLANFKKMLNPITYAVLLGFLVNTIGITLPSLVTDTIEQVGSVSTPLGMIYLGASLCFMEWRNVQKLEGSLVYAATKMFLVPLLVYVVARRFFPEVESVVLMLTCASPSTTLTVMIARQNRLDVDYAGEIVSISTLACAVTVPLLFLCVGFL